MSILADYEIQRLCVAPTFIKTPTDPMVPLGSERLVSAPYTPLESEYLRLAEGNGISSRDFDWTLHPYDARIDGPFEPMIEPFHSEQVRRHEGGPVLSYGLSSYGYDVTVGRQFKVFTNVNNSLLDPKDVDYDAFVDVEGDYCIIPPNSFALAATNEYFRMPDDVIVTVVGKSTYARLGVQAIVTPIEPGFHGQVVIEFANCTPLPVKLYANEGVAQFLFFRGNPCLRPYGPDRKYFAQTGVTLSRM